jgi:hypothetical protein
MVAAVGAAGCATGGAGQTPPTPVQAAAATGTPAKRGPWIDAHMHLQSAEWFSGNVFARADRGPRRRKAPPPRQTGGGGSSSIEEASQSTRRSYAPTLEGQTERILDEMNEAGIDTAFLMAMDYDYTGEKLRVDHYKQIELLAGVRDKHPGRFVLFAAIDPRRGEAGVEMLRRAHNEFAISGMGEFAPHFFGYPPNDRRCYPIYEACAELDLPLAPNCSIVASHISRYCDPVYLEDVAIDFPTLNICLTSAGISLWTDTAMALCQSKANIFMDTADWQAKVTSDQIGTTIAFVRQALDTDARRKILFGSDFPVYARSVSEKAWVEVFTTEARKRGVEFTEEELHLFFSDNAQEFLDLDLAMPAGAAL